MATQTVTAFNLGFTEQSRHPYALAVLSCGHAASVTMRPNRYACAECQAPAESCAARCACGYFGYRLAQMMDPHISEHRVTQVGDALECEACDRVAAEIEWLRALPVADVQHVRFRQWCGVGQYHFYRRDASSPTGVFHMGTVTATPVADAILREKRISPLSPTEAR